MKVSVRAGHILSPSLRPAAVGRATELCPALSDFPVTPGDLISLNAILRQHKILSGTCIFCPRLGTKKSPCSIGHKRLSSKAIFTKFFCQVNSWIAILRQHKILSGTYIFCPRLGTKKSPCSIGSVLKQSLLNYFVIR